MEGSSIQLQSSLFLSLMEYQKHLLSSRVFRWWNIFGLSIDSYSEENYRLHSSNNIPCSESRFLLGSVCTSKSYQSKCTTVSQACLAFLNHTYLCAYSALYALLRYSSHGNYTCVHRCCLLHQFEITWAILRK